MRVDRGGTLIGTIGRARSVASDELRGARSVAAWRVVVRCRYVLAVVVIAVALAMLPGRSSIPPLVQSDYLYMLIAADRMHDGLGYSSLQPIAPHQPWSWRYDFGWLAQWPPAYPWLVVGVRKITGWATMEACRHLGTLCCAVALVGWFALIRRAVPRGGTGGILAAVGAAQAVSVAMLVDPSTDLLLCAALPYVLLLVARGFTSAVPGRDRAGVPLPLRGRAPAATITTASVPEYRDSTRGCDPAPLSGRVVDGARRVVDGDASYGLALAGLAAGGLFWIRYASVFVPIGIGMFLVSRVLGRGLRFRSLVWFAGSAAVPIVGLVVLNRVMSAGATVQESLNLGTRMGVEFSLAAIGEAWWRWTDLGFYDYRPAAHWVFALSPIVIASSLFIPAVRRRARVLLHNPIFGIGAASVAALLMMLVLSTALFGEKFDYIGLDRYYKPARPLYFVLFVAPLAIIANRWTRAILIVGLCIAASWTVQQAWARPYARHLAADHPVTAYGQRSIAFHPGANARFQWLRGQANPDLIVVSNFHDVITLETGIPALPPPPDEAALRRWIDRIVEQRGIGHPRVLFVLDPDNGWRSYYLPDPGELRTSLRLTPETDAPSGVWQWAREHDIAALGSDRR